MTGAGGIYPPPPPFNLINRQINCFGCIPLSMVLTNNSALPQPAMPALACITISSPRVTAAVAVPLYAFCM